MESYYSASSNQPIEVRSVVWFVEVCRTMYVHV
jgi:hypothetical protein